MSIVLEGFTSEMDAYQGTGSWAGDAAALEEFAPSQPRPASAGADLDAMFGIGVALIVSAGLWGVILLLGSFLFA